MFRIYRWDKDFTKRVRGTLSVKKNHGRRIQLNLLFTENASQCGDMFVEKLIDMLDAEGVRLEEVD